MHGSSSVPQDWLEIINSYGGEMGETYGVPVEEIQEGIKHGVRKVNIDTDLRMASTGAVRKHLAENPSNFDPRKFLKASTAAMKDICRHVTRLLAVLVMHPGSSRFHWMIWLHVTSVENWILKSVSIHLIRFSRKGAPKAPLFVYIA